MCIIYLPYIFTFRMIIYNLYLYIKRDEALNKLYVAFKDPDRIQWEFYMA